MLLQPVAVILTARWLPGARAGEVSKQMQNYFTTICQAVADKDEEVRNMALAEVRSNCRIGPIVEWFYWFGFFLLRKDTTSSSLPLWGLDLIEALEMNHIGPMSATELQVRMSLETS